MRLPNITSTTIFHNWKEKIKVSCLHGHWKTLLSHYLEINKVGLQLEDPSLIPPIFKACANLHYFKQGTSFHACMIKHSLDSFTSVGNSIMDFYMKCGYMNSAISVFHCLENKDSVTWNILIHGGLNQLCLGKGLCMFVRARAVGFEPNISTLVLVLQACRTLPSICEGLSIHGFLIRSGYLADVSVQNSLLSFYSETGEMEFALRLFDEMLIRDVISWSVVIGMYIQNGESLNALLCFQDMVSGDEVQPDEFTLVSILKACTNIRDIVLGRLLHGFVIRRGFVSDTFMGNSLVDMYSKCIDTESALKVFNEITQRSIVSWNSIISGLVYNEQYREALTFFTLMRASGFEADEVTMVTILQICKNFANAIQCKSIHSRVIRWGFESSELVKNALMDAYAKCNLPELAWELFIHMEQKDIISWSTIITAFSQSGKPEVALNLFQRMSLLKEIRFNSVTMLNLLEACSIIGDLRRSKWAHGIAIRFEMTSEVAVGTALLNMYSKCGALDTSRKIFDRMTEKNLVSWSAMIAAYGTHGHVNDALSLLAKMEKDGLRPSAVTMISILSACSHGGLIKEGISCFQRMVQEHGFQPRMEHFSCIVDMLGRAGSLNSAMDVIKSMPAETNAGPSVWGALLGACRNYGNSELGEGAASHVLELEPLKSAGYVLASSIYAANGLWDNAARLRSMVKDKGVKAVAGYSLVHVENRGYRFVSGDRSHQYSKEIHSIVEQLCLFLKMDDTHDALPFM